MHKWSEVEGCVCVVMTLKHPKAFQFLRILHAKGESVHQEVYYGTTGGFVRSITMFEKSESTGKERSQTTEDDGRSVPANLRPK